MLKRAEPARRGAGARALAGSFPAPVPAGCDTPPGSLAHIHGRDDATAPLAGRPFGPARQGDVDKALAMHARHGGFGSARTTRAEDPECSLRNAPGSDRIPAFCLFDGGHSFHPRDLRSAWETLESASRRPRADRYRVGTEAISTADTGASATRAARSCKPHRSSADTVSGRTRPIMITAPSCPARNAA